MSYKRNDCAKTQSPAAESIRFPKVRYRQSIPTSLLSKRGVKAAAIYTVVETCKLNGVEPQAYIADVITKIAGNWPASRWDELMPWNWRPDFQTIAEAASHWSRSLEHRLYGFASSAGVEIPEPPLLRTSLRPLFLLSGVLILLALAIALTRLRQ